MTTEAPTKRKLVDAFRQLVGTPWKELEDALFEVSADLSLESMAFERAACLKIIERRWPDAAAAIRKKRETQEKGVSL